MTPLDLASWAETAVGGSMALALPVALLAGLVSFFSPCVVPLLPGYLSYATGLGAAEVVEGSPRRGRMLAGASLFVLGFAVVFVITGVVAGSAGRLLAEYRDVISRVLGVVIIMLGLIFAGVLRIGQRDLRLHRIPAVGRCRGAAARCGVRARLDALPVTDPRRGGQPWLQRGHRVTRRTARLRLRARARHPVRDRRTGLHQDGPCRRVPRERQQLIMRIGGILMVIVGLLLVTGTWDTLTARAATVGVELRDGDLMTHDQDSRVRRPSPASRLRKPTCRSLGWRGGLRYLWTQLTSMRTALILLFALALAAIPGSLVPQRRVSPVRVTDFINEHPTLGPIYDKLGLFDVYTSPWFSAIYLLLFVSLVGCIIPRVGVYAKALRARPPKTPRNLVRLPAYAAAEIDR